MIPLAGQILLALLLDLLCGDPRWLPHPVKGIGRLALAIEAPLRPLLPLRAAGAVAVLLVVAVSTGLAWLCVVLAGYIHPLGADLVAIALLYTCFALQDLRHHALNVYWALAAGDLPLARRRVALLVGRDTEGLDAGEIARAAVESVAENTVDGVTAPLFFAFVGGVPGAVLYKAVNTLDSTYGYKNERYLEFGWAAARLDDLVNFVPARISALLVPLAARLSGLYARQAWMIFKRDRFCHPSPNGGQIEAAMAGALNIRLGGENRYFGRVSFRPHMGDAGENIRAAHIKLVIQLMQMTSLGMVFMGLLFLWLRQAII